jgi:conjugative relaxase-like TrwC/TraI family protein
MASAAAFLSKKASAGAIAWVSREEGQEANELALANSLAAILERDGMPATWSGTAAAGLGLTGPAKLADIRSIMEKNEWKGKALGSGQTTKTCMGIIVPAPKTISALMAHPDQTVRDNVEAAHRAGTQAYVKALEATLTSRRQKGGVVSVGVTGIAAAEWVHRTSSTGDAHLHSHLFIANPAPGADGKWNAIDGNLFLAAKRVAEAAYLHTLKAEISSRLTLAKNEWERKMVGSAPTWELKSLAPAVASISGARSHIEAVTKKLEKALEDMSWAEDRLAWQQHRKEKGALSERIEHELDAGLIEGGERAEAIRQMWRKSIGGSMFYINGIKARAQPTVENAIKPDAASLLRRFTGAERLEMPVKPSTSDLTYKRGMTRIPPNDFNVRRKEALQKFHAAEKNYEESLGLPFWKFKQKDQAKFGLEKATARYDKLIAEIDKDEAENKAAVLVITNKIEEIEENHREAVALYEAAAALEKPAAEALEHLADLSEFTLSDTAAWMLEHCGGDISTAYRVAGSLMDEWQKKGLVHCATGNRDAVELMLRKTECATGDITKTLQTKAVTDHALREEAEIRKEANWLCNEKRRPLAIEVTKLSNEQAAAAAKMARGRALTVISGVAGAGKTYLMQPAMDAARKAKAPVIVVARNTQRAQDVATELGLQKGMSCAELSLEMRKKDSKIPRNAIFLVDEAGLIDRHNWRDLLELAKKGGQIIAVGDREQAQAIDRRATFATIEKAAGMADQQAVLTKSYRNVKWEEEANALRTGKAGLVVEKALKEGRIHSAADHDLFKKAAELAKEHADRDESVTVICPTNAEAAEVARRIQHLRGLRGNVAISKHQYAAVGDRVRTRLNDHPAKIRNGDEWIVTKTSQESLTLQRAGGGRVVEVAADYFRSNVELAYAATVDSAQGITIDRPVLPLSTVGSDRQRVYSGATRGKEAPIYVMSSGRAEAEKPEEAASRLRRSIDRDGLAHTAEEIARAAHEANHYVEPVEDESSLAQGRRGAKPNDMVMRDQAAAVVKAEKPAEKTDKYSELVAAAKADSEAEVEGMSPQQTMRAEMEARHKAAQTPRRGVRMR